MFNVLFRIFVRTAAGEVFEAFTWTRSAESGIARAFNEGKEFGFDVIEAWAEPVIVEG